jgi:hypothetical protein
MTVQILIVQTLLQQIDNLGVSSIQWGGTGSTPLADGDTGTPISLPQKMDMSFQATGTFGAGGSVAIEVSNDGVNYFAAKDSNGTLIALTAAAPIARLTGPWLWVRPHATAGDGTTAILVNGIFRSPKQG